MSHLPRSKADGIVRRQTQLEDLSATNAELNAKVAALQATIDQQRAGEGRLKGWVSDLESTLIRHNLGYEMDAIRHRWTMDTSMGTSTRPRRVTEPIFDPLGTLANAAVSRGPPQPSVIRPRGSFDSYPYPGPAPSLFTSQPQEHLGQKRKRQPSYPIHPATLPPINQPRMEQPRLTRAPTHSALQEHFPPEWTGPRPSTAPQTAPYELTEASPRTIRISDLLSPLPVSDVTNVDNHRALQVTPVSAYPMEPTFSQDSNPGLAPEFDRRSSGAISVITPFPRNEDHRLTGAHSSFDSLMLSKPYLGPVIPSYPSTSTHGVDSLPSPPWPQASVEHTAVAFPATDHPGCDPPNVPLGLDAPRVHPSVYTARQILLSLLPSPLPFPLPPLPPLDPSLQRLLLVALTNLVPPQHQAMFHQRQLKYLPAQDAKVLLEYQAQPETDARLILLPVAILRAKIVKRLSDGLDFDISSFVNDTLSKARLFGSTLDPDAWEMPDDFWDDWEDYFAKGRSYCASLSKWRRKDGHSGSTVMEMILGVEGEMSRREEPLGKPPNWTF